MKRLFLVAIGATVHCFLGLAVFGANVARPSPALRAISYNGLPQITYETKGQHLSAVLVNDRLVLSIVATADGVQQIIAPGSWTWNFETIPNSSVVHHRFAVTGGVGKYDGDVLVGSQAVDYELPVWLDTVARDIGLPDRWQTVTTVKEVGGGAFDVADSRTSQTLVRLRRFEDDVRVGLAHSGTPLFYDLQLPISVPANQTGTVPTRLIVTATGSIQFGLKSPTANALTSVVWSIASRGVTYTYLVAEAAHAGRVNALLFWQCGSYYSCYDDPSTGYYTCWWQDEWCYSPDPAPPPPPDPDSGGGTPPSPPPPGSREWTQQQYSDYGCTVPALSKFLDRSQYNATGMMNYFSFDAWKSSQSDYVLVDQGTINGLAAMQAELDTMSLPSLSAPGAGAGYRVAGENSSTPCGTHCYGRGVDLSIRNSSGAHDCHIWNVLAAAAHMPAGGSSLRARSSPPAVVRIIFMSVSMDARTRITAMDATRNHV